jgi:hypothetical protein
MAALSVQAVYPQLPARPAFGTDLANTYTVYLAAIRGDKPYLWLPDEKAKDKQPETAKPCSI